jgi:hypothetical protein
MTLWFYGDMANVTQNMYVKLNAVKKPYPGDMTDITRQRWTQWNVDLTGISLNNVTSVAIGFERSGAGGTGTVLFDDIRLYGAGKAPSITAPVNPGTTGLVGWYKFEDNVLDSSNSSPKNNGTLMGAPLYQSWSSAYGKAIVLNGTTDSVDLGNKPVWNPAGSFSVSLWANPAAWATSYGNVMVSNGGEGTTGWQVRRYSNNNFCFTTRGTGTTSPEDTPSTIGPTVNEWVHIACVYDSVNNTKSIYINGVLNVTVNTTAGAKIAATTLNTYIGYRPLIGTVAESFFNGMLDDVRIYMRALSAEEVDYLSDPTP